MAPGEDRDDVRSDRFGRDRAEQDRDGRDRDSAGRGRGGVECADGFVRGGGNIRDPGRILHPPTGGDSANGKNRYL